MEISLMIIGVEITLFTIVVGLYCKFSDFSLKNYKKTLDNI